LYNIGTTGWLTNRATTHTLIAAQSVPLMPGRESSRELFLPALQWIGVVPSGAVLLMIILATSAVCGTAILRARTEFQTSAAQLSQMSSEIDSLRYRNQNLLSEVDRLTKDSNAIELAARERLGMVKPNDVVVTIESIPSSKGDISFVH
jgi:cell division protein FtsB